MPFKSESQERLMEGIAHGMKPREKDAPSKKVAKKFIRDSSADLPDYIPAHHRKKLDDLKAERNKDRGK